MAEVLTLLNKNTELNNILKDYSIAICTNSYILNENASMIEVPYSKKAVNTNISQYLYLDVDNRINNFQTTYNVKNKFNFTYTYYQSNYNIIENSLIISNIGIDSITSYQNSYIVFYNTNCGLKQLSYHFNEGNGLYYDQTHHVFNMNIDNNTIKEINKKLFFDTNSIPISSKENYGISYVDNKYLKVNNGILSIDLSYIENIISYKYKIKNLYESLNSIYNSLLFYDDIDETKSNNNEFEHVFDDVTNNISKTIVNYEITYNLNNSLYFPQSEIKYIDNYYFSNNLINEKYKQYIKLSEDNSYIIYCKDLSKIEISTYIENNYYNYQNHFDLKSITEYETNSSLTSNYIQETINSNELYIDINDDQNNYNQFIISTTYTDKKTLEFINGIHYNFKNFKLKYNQDATSNNESDNENNNIFKLSGGIILNSKLTLPKFNKNIVKCKKSTNKINYEYEIQHINCKYDSPNIKILYDTRNISYCTHNLNPIPEDVSGDCFYFLSDNNGDKLLNNEKTIDRSFLNLFKNFDISFNNDLTYLFYGYCWKMKDNNKFNKIYHGIWHDLPIYFIKSNFIDFIIKTGNNESIKTLPLSNFLELYAQNFNEIEFDINNYQPKCLYLYKIKNLKLSKVDNVTINI